MFTYKYTHSTHSCLSSNFMLTVTVSVDLRDWSKKSLVIYVFYLNATSIILILLILCSPGHSPYHNTLRFLIPLSVLWYPGRSAICFLKKSEPHDEDSQQTTNSFFLQQLDFRFWYTCSVIVHSILWYRILSIYNLKNMFTVIFSILL